MRFISMHATDVYCEAGDPPPPELIEGMGRLVGDMVQAGVFEAGEGLRSSRLGIRLNYRAGRRSETAGPFTPNNELQTMIVIVNAADRDAAVQWADRHAQVLGDVEIDVRPVNEAWHIGLAPAPPAGSPERFMLQIKADARTEAGTPLPPAQAATLQRLHAEMRQAGVLLAVESIRPSREGLRIHYDAAAGERRVIDGPFAESKELIAGFCIMNVKSRAEAEHWTDRFASNFPQVHVEIRLLDQPAGAA